MKLNFQQSVPVVMGVLNVTPDSFSDGGQFVDGRDVDVPAAVERAMEMVDEGARIIDIGGESTGPRSVDVSLEAELGRVLPVVAGLRTVLEVRADLEGRDDGSAVVISVDTWKSEVARQALEAGATMVNDVTALRGDVEMARVVAECGAPVVLMYAKDDTARTTRAEFEYEDVVATIKAFLEERIDYAVAQGIGRENIILDPGMGLFVSAKPEYSWEILERLSELDELGCPILVGASRKSFLGGKVGERLHGSLKAARMATQNGAQIIRAHDIAETVDFAI